MIIYVFASGESDDVIGGSETAQHSIENNSRNIKAVFFKLGTRNVHDKTNRKRLSNKQQFIFYFLGT